MSSSITINISDDLANPEVNVKIVSFAGQLDESNVDENSAIIYDLINKIPNGTFLIFDLYELTYMNSKSIGYLTDWHLKATDKEGQIILARAKENIVDILNVVGLTQIIKSFETLDEARLAILQIAENRKSQ